MDHLSIDYTNMAHVITDEMLSQLQPELDQALQKTLEKTGAGKEFLGWVTLPHEITPVLLEDIQQTAADLRSKSTAILSVGIGGSYLGARATIEALHGPFRKQRAEDVPVLFAGQNLSAWYMQDLLHLLEGQDFSVIVISKSGTTTEPGVAFRILRKTLEEQYGAQGARDRIVAITDKAHGALKQLATNEGYRTYVIPDDVGGRFSVLTPVGLLPIACAGIDIQDFVNGFQAMATTLTQQSDVLQNPALAYAAIRTLLYRQGKQIELLVNFEPALHYVAEWWKQLFGESEGKDGKSLFPASVDFTTDLHSMGQWIQEGVRILFETFLIVKHTDAVVPVPHDEDNLDGLNYLAGKNLEDINRSAYQGTALAHRDGGAPSLTIELPALTPYYLGQIYYFFEMAVAVSGYMLGVNPFNQPGVEAYKKNMFALLGKPGFDQAHQDMIANIQATSPKRIG
ncbi:glucose-6-phosphate isomerase [candidate division KSB3 bacterium]|uniref:Glucose-6-phosphate isomerase n=1 Tax=candidate division KSB3 bacterium TaxID=2044937 RepID=A0A9D5Q683_9BACT|nr:glucose-6-phosphate isomerase [candidate division KSB3 bacterium]MBD3325138.1 glucose-6-phosphate isomerase [candidate division KSB3 bacterium]